MELSALGLWYVCALGTTAFAAQVPLRRLPVAVAILGFAGSAWWVAPAGVVGVAPVALATAVLAGWAVSRPVSPLVPALTAGVLSGIWTGLLASQGVPLTLAVIVAASVPLISLVMAARRPTFAPPLLRDESLLLVCALSLIVAALPSILDGWRAAGNLALQSESPDLRVLMPMWALVLTGAAAALGGLYAIWSRR